MIKQMAQFGFEHAELGRPGLVFGVDKKSTLVPVSCARPHIFLADALGVVEHHLAVGAVYPFILATALLQRLCSHGGSCQPSCLFVVWSANGHHLTVILRGFPHPGLLSFRYLCSCACWICRSISRAVAGARIEPSRDHLRSLGDGSRPIRSIVDLPHR